MQISTTESLNKSNSLSSSPIYQNLSFKDKKPISFILSHKSINHQIPKCFKCDIDDCILLFQTESELLNHKNNCHKKIYKCPYEKCEKYFYKTINLNKHYKSHFPLFKKYKCSYPGCNKSFTASYNLSIHNRKHTGEQPYCCEKCGMKFSVRANYKYHVSVKHNFISMKEKCCQHKGCYHESKTVKQKMLHHDKLEEECVSEKNNLISLLIYFRKSINFVLGNYDDANELELDRIKKNKIYRDITIDIQKQSQKLYDCALDKDQYKDLL